MYGECLVVCCMKAMFCAKCRKQAKKVRQIAKKRGERKPAKKSGRKLAIKEDRNQLKP
jgi:hypothetical protein